jgi:hypothetical protein
VPLPLGSLPAALPALTHLDLSCCDDVDVAGLSGLTGLRRLEIWAQGRAEGVSRLTALEDLCLKGDDEPLAQPSDLAPLTALTRLAMWCVPPELGSFPAAARLRRLELQAFGILHRAPRGGAGGGANGAAAAALAALARGAPLLERLRIQLSSGGGDDKWLLQSHPEDIELGPPLGPGVAWPSLTHLQVKPWAALLLAACAFPRLSRLVADVYEVGGDKGIAYNERLRTAVAALAGKARDHAALVIEDERSGAPYGGGVLAAAGAVPRLRHLSWHRSRHLCAAAGPPGHWARLASSLESLELTGRLSTFGYAEPLAGLAGLTRLSFAVKVEDAGSAAAAPPPLPRAGGARRRGEPPVGPAGSAAARTARALARLPRLAHLRLTSFEGESPGVAPDWVCPAVAAELARCPALRLLEIDRRDSPMWRHERGSPSGPGPVVPRPSPAWPPFVQALRAGGSGAAVRPVPQSMISCFRFES